MAPPSPSSSLSAHPSASHSSSASASAATKQPIDLPDYIPVNGYDSQGFIYHINLFTLCILALFVLFGLPRLLARFHHRNEYLNGHLLRSVFFPTPSARKPSTKSNRSYRMQYPQQAGPSSDKATNGYDDYDSKEAYSDDDHNSQAHLTSPFSPVSPTSPTETYAYQAYRGHPSAVYPPHVPSCPKHLRPLLVLLRRRVTPGFSWAKLLILTGWFFLLFYAGFFKAPDMPFLDPIRMGWLAVGTLPWAYGFASKNNIIGWVVGKSYEKVTLVFFFNSIAHSNISLTISTALLAALSSSLSISMPLTTVSCPASLPSHSTYLRTQSTSGNTLAHFTRKSFSHLTCGA
jgi:hypothetical protein